MAGATPSKDQPEEITVRSVIEAIEGPIYINKCLESDDLCNAGRAKTCEIHKALSTVQKNLLAELDAITFAKILAGSQTNQQQN